MTCCPLHPYIATLTKQAKPVGWDGTKPLGYNEQYWAVSLRGKLICEPMFADRVSAENYIWLLECEAHGKDPGILEGELIIDG